MDVKEAVAIALKYTSDLFGSQIAHLGLEEVAFDDVEGAWEVTVGFSRQWGVNLSEIFPSGKNREYKVVKLDNDTKEVKSVKIREFSSES